MNSEDKIEFWKSAYEDSSALASRLARELLVSQRRYDRGFLFPEEHARDNETEGREVGT